MRGYAHSGQPTVILRVFANAWICAQRATDRDLESVNAMEKSECLDMCTPFNRP